MYNTQCIYLHILYISYSSSPPVLIFCFMLALYHHENTLLTAGNAKGHMLQSLSAPRSHHIGSAPNSWPCLRQRLCLKEANEDVASRGNHNVWPPPASTGGAEASVGKGNWLFLFLHFYSCKNPDEPQLCSICSICMFFGSDHVPPTCICNPL